MKKITSASAYDFAFHGIVLLDAVHKHGFLHLAIEELDPQDIQDFVFNGHVRAQVLAQCFGNDVACATKKFNRQQKVALDFFTRVRSYASR